MEPATQGEIGKEVAKLSQVIQIDEGKIQAHLGEVVRSTVEETLNALLDAEADHLRRAERYERTEARKDTRAVSYQRQLRTKVGEERDTLPPVESDTKPTDLETRCVFLRVIGTVSNSASEGLLCVRDV